MIIYYISGSVIPSRTANSIHVTSFCDAILKKKLKLKLFGIKKYFLQKKLNKLINKFYNTELNRENIYLIFYPFKRFIEVYITFYSLIIFLNDKLSNNKPNLIISRNLFASYIYSFFFKNLIYETHIPETGIRKLIQKKIILGGIKTVVITQNLLKYFNSEDFSKSDKKNLNIYVLSDAAKFYDRNLHEYKINKTKKLLDSSFPLFKNNFFVGYFGHLYKGSGIDKIIALAKENKDISFVIFGGDDNYIKKNKIENSNNNLIFFGFIDPAYIYEYMASMDLLLMPYDSSVFLKNNKTNKANWMSPLKLFEYMASFTPILSSNLSVFKDVLKDNQNCSLAESNDLNDWNKKLNYIKNNKEFGYKLAKNAYDDYLKKYTWDIRLAKLLDISKLNRS